jgi:tagaturonate reductase
LPSVLGYIDKFDKVPTNLTFAFACLIRFYKGTWNEGTLPVDDSKEITSAFQSIWASNDVASVVAQTLSNTDFWGEDLTKIKGLSGALVLALNEIEANGIEQGFVNFNKQV